MNKYYDYVIIGGGPTGLTLALYLSKYYKIAIIEKEDQIGGCHSVKRIDGLFSEHGPRIYLDNYLVFKDILKNELNITFNKLWKN
jgi:phytoene dehydrogenase-like protein